jgi:hypothetical protein
MIVNAKWSNFRKQYRETSENYSEWVKVVDVSVPAIGITVPLYLPQDVVEDDITTYLKSSQELIGQLAEEHKQRKEHDFELTL